MAGGPAKKEKTPAFLFLFSPGRFFTKGWGGGSQSQKKKNSPPQLLLVLRFFFKFFLGGGPPVAFKRGPGGGRGGGGLGKKSRPGETRFWVFFNKKGESTILKMLRVGSFPAYQPLFFLVKNF